jgi:hypothetical protein
MNRKPAAFATIFVMLLTTQVFAQKSLYVKAGGDDRETNNGLSEDRPLGTLHVALLRAQAWTVKRITIIGTLDETSETMSSSFKAQFDTVFACLGGEGDKTEITITGKPDAAGAERAVLSAQGARARAGVLFVDSDIPIRLEHIEISGGEHPRIQRATGIDVRGGTLTLGPGAIVRGNQGVGVLVYSDSSCVIDDGDIQGNGDGGVYVSMACTLTLRNGSIANNKTTTNGGGVSVGIGGAFIMSGGSIAGNSTGSTDCYFGGGVAIMPGGTFTMSEGSITDNTAVIGGGVFVYKGGIFTQTGGSISGNQTPEDTNRDLFIDEGAIVDIRDVTG